MKSRNDNKSKLLSGLLRRAEGLEAEERTVEYVLDEEGNRRAVKEKMQIKYYPPDVSAAKVCLELERGTEKGLGALSDEEIEREKIRLMKELDKLCNKNRT